MSKDDLHHQGRISSILNRITTYQAGIAPNVSDVEQGKGRPVSFPSYCNEWLGLAYYVMNWIKSLSLYLYLYTIYLLKSKIKCTLDHNSYIKCNKVYNWYNIYKIIYLATN